MTGNKMRFSGIALLLLMLAVASCKTQKATSSTEEGETLLKFKNEAVSQAEFERVYQKNNGGYEAAKKHTNEQYREYLDLYINFKRKVFEAEELELNETDAFVREFEQYRKQLAQPYLRAKEVEEKLVEEAYDRSKYMINASHLLVRLPESPSPSDTLAGWKLINNYRDSIVNGGKDFGYMAEKYSGDPSAKQNKGYLGYFTAFNMVYPFETGAYNTNPGGISQPIRTRFGYHLVNVNEKVKLTGLKRAGHILIRIGDRYSAKDTAMAERKIAEIYEKLKQGEPFADLAEKYSDDPSTSAKGGDLGTGRLLPVMDSVKLKLELSEFSKPFNTQFGWHILHISEEKPIKSLEESKSEIQRKIERDSRAQISKSALINRIKKDYNFELEQGNFDEFVGTLDKSFTAGAWRPDSAKEESLYQKDLFSINDGKTTVEKNIQDLITFYLRNPIRSRNTDPKVAANTLLKMFTERELLAFEEQKLPEKNPEYRNLLKEYRDGILLFTLMEQKVWKKAVEDTTGLEKFYEKNKENFQADETVDVWEFRATSQEKIDEVEALFNDGKSIEEVDSLVNAEGSLDLRVSVQTYEKGKGGVDESMFSQKEGYKTPVQKKGELYKIMVIKEKRPAGIKPFEYAKSEAITQYQDYLEKEWLAELKKKYPVEVNEDVFNKLFE